VGNEKMRNENIRAELKVKGV